MTLRCLPALCVVLCAAGPVLAQPELDKKQIDAIQKMQGLLDSEIVEANHFQTEMPLVKFLEALQQQFPKEMKLALRIDKDAFGAKFAEVAATPMMLPEKPQSLTLRKVLEIALAKIKTKADYRLDAGQVAFTTPDRALYTAVYDIGDIIERPESWARIFDSAMLKVNLRQLDPAERAAILVQALVKEDEPVQEFSAGIGKKPIQLVNGTSLAVQVNAAKHAQIAEFLAVCRRLMDVKVLVQAKLYEVDEAFYKALKPASLKRLSLDELEQMFRDGKLDQSLGNALAKQKPIVTGNDVILDPGLAATVLSQHHILTLLPSPAQVRKGEKGPQSILEGVSFAAHVEVRSDRRGVRVKWTEKIAELEAIEKTKVHFFPSEKVEPAEIAFIKNTTFTRDFEVGDGGGIILAVQYRPKSAQLKDRWLVVHLTCRIIIQAEEEMDFRGSLGSLLPDLILDVLKNPLLKSTRDFYGSPGDKHYALLDSDTWKWSVDSRPKFSSYQVAPAKKEGQRLLGIRVDKFEPETGYVTVTLTNAGGSANGAAIGGCTLRFKARQEEDGWKFELVQDGP